MPSVERAELGRPASGPPRMGRRTVWRDTQRLGRDMSLAGARARGARSLPPDHGPAVEIAS
jgi:hypothetical protein